MFIGFLVLYFLVTLRDCIKNVTEMILIADSGSTKVDWRAIKQNGEVVSANTEGLNPVFVSKEFIVNVLKDKLVPVIGEGVKEVCFYGAGVVSPEHIKTISDAVDEAFGGAVCYAASDLLAAARALCGHSEGIACIMGTGGNTCFYDGENIVDNVKAGGFILGDEGSGGNLGKRLVSDFIKGLLPKHIEAEFVKRYDLDYMKIVDRVYKQPMPNRFLASFCPFINEFRDDEHIKGIVMDCFRDFFERNISHYNYKQYKVNLVGSVAYYFSDYLTEAAGRFGAEIGKILKSPIDGLVEYHRAIK